MYSFENSSEAQPKIVEKYEIVRGKTEQLIQGKGFGLLTVYNMSISENNQFGFYYYNQDGDIERMSLDFDDIKIKEVEEDTDFEELNIHWIEKWCDRLNISMTNTTFH